MKSIFFLVPRLINLGFALVLLLQSCVSFRPPLTSISPLVEKGQLENGLAYYVMPHRFPKNRCSLRLNIKVGSFHEHKNESGIAHLIEHLAFENRVMGPDKELAVWFQEQGMSVGPDANAFTTIDHTVYHMDLTNCQEQSIKDGLTILHSFLSDIQFNDETILKQKLIIDEEERHYKNTLSKLNEKISHKLFEGTLFDTNFILGEKEIRNNISKDMLKAFYQKWYRSSHAQIVLVGDIDPFLAKNHIHAIFSDLPKTEPLAPIERGIPSFKEPAFITYAPEIKSVETVLLLQPKAFVLQSFNRESFEKKLAFELALIMLEESIVKKSAKQNPDELGPAQFYGIFGDYHKPELSLTTSTTLENQATAFKRAFGPIKRALDHGFEDTAFKRAVNKKIDNLEQNITEEITYSSPYWTQKILDYVNQRGSLLDAKTTASLTKDILKTLSPESCKNALRAAFNDSNIYLFAFGNIEENQDNLAKITQLLKDILTDESKILSNKDEKKIEFLYHVTNASVVVKKRDYFKDIDTHLIEFANNFRLVVKNSSLQKDTILVELDNDHGLYTMSAKDIATLDLAGSTLLSGGLKKHSWKEIIQLTNDKVIRLWPRSSLESLGLYGVTRAEDFRFSLELMRAFLTEPDFNISALNQAKNQAQLSYEEAQHLISWPLQLSFPSLLTKNDPRAIRASLPLIQKVERDDLLSWHKKWVQGDTLTMTIVGDINVESAINEVGAVFGSLPTLTAMSAPSKPHPITFAKGIHRTFHVDTKDKASRIIIRYPLDINKENKYLLLLTQNLIQEALRLTLREEERAIYSPQVSFNFNAQGAMQNALDILLSGDPSKMKFIKNRALDIVTRLAQKGATTSQLELAKTTLSDNLTRQDENVSFWLEFLSSNRHQLSELAHPDTRPALLEKINIKDINAYLKKYFLPSNTSTAIINGTPKKLQDKK